MPLSEDSRRARRRYLINPRFQLRFLLLSLITTVAAFGVLGHLYVRELSTAAALLRGLDDVERTLVVTDTAAARDVLVQMRGALQRDDAGVTIALFAALLALVAGLSFAGVAATHRIAGPIHAVDTYLAKLAHEHYAPMRAFRKGDEFVFLRDRLVELHDSLVRREQIELETLEQIRERLPSDAQTADLTADLSPPILGKRRRLSLG